MDDSTLNEMLRPSDATIAFLKMFARTYRVTGGPILEWGNECLN